MKVLGIETSCDETAAAVVEDGIKLLSNSVASSVDLHAAYGGVVPEIAARSHLESILPVIEDALKTAHCGWNDIDAVAVTYGPGLIGSLLIGVLTARTLAITKNKPLTGVNHVMAHPYAAFITNTALSGYHVSSKPPQFPALALIVSGGHTQLVLFESHVKYKILGQTRDDAVGEAYDKVAKILGLPYPGGPSVSQAAQSGNRAAIKLPTAQLDNPYDFSFSGLKTAVLRASQTLVGKDFTLPSSQLASLLNERQKADIAASFQATAINTLVTKLHEAAKQHNPASIIVAGGVAANQELRHQITEAIRGQVFFPDIKLCTDNGAMIATRGYFQLKAGHKSDPYTLTVDPGLKM